MTYFTLTSLTHVQPVDYNCWLIVKVNLPLYISHPGYILSPDYNPQV